jgi:hypothetical protein
MSYGFFTLKTGNQELADNYEAVALSLDVEGARSTQTKVLRSAR